MVNNKQYQQRSTDENDKIKIFRHIKLYKPKFSCSLVASMVLLYDRWLLMSFLQSNLKILGYKCNKAWDVWMERFRNIVWFSDHLLSACVSSWSSDGYDS